MKLTEWRECPRCGKTRQIPVGRTICTPCCGPCSTCGGTHRVWLPTPTYGSPRYHARTCPDCETT